MVPAFLGTAGLQSRAFFAGFCSRRRKSPFCARLKLYMVKGTYLSNSDSTQQNRNGVHAVPGSLWGGKLRGEKACSGQASIAVSAFPCVPWFCWFSLTPTVLSCWKLQSGFCSRGAGKACTWSASCFALHEGPPHSPHVTLTDKVNRIKKMLPNAF